MGVGGAICFDLKYVFVISLLHHLGQLLIYSFCEVNENLLKCPGSHTIVYRCKCHIFSLKLNHIILVPRFWIFNNSVDVLIPIMVFVVRHWNDYAQSSHPSRWESHVCKFCRLGGTTTLRLFPAELAAEPFNPELCKGGKEETGGACVCPAQGPWGKAGEEMRWIHSCLIINIALINSKISVSIPILILSLYVGLNNSLFWSWQYYTFWIILFNCFQWPLKWSVTIIQNAQQKLLLQYLGLFLWNVVPQFFPVNFYEGCSLWNGWEGFCHTGNVLYFLNG